MRVIGSGYVYDAAAGPPHGRVCAHTTISLLHDGTVLVAFRRGSARDSLDGHVCVFASTDQGETWELRHDGVGLGAWDDTPGEVKCLAIAELTPGVLTGTSLWVDRSRPSYRGSTHRPKGCCRCACSTPPPPMAAARGATGGRYLPRRTPRPRPAPRPSWPCPAACWPSPMSTGKPTKTGTTPRPGARLRLSSDAGATWPEYVTVATHPDAALYYWDQRLGCHPETEPTRCDVLDPRCRPSAKIGTSTLPGEVPTVAPGHSPSAPVCPASIANRCPSAATGWWRSIPTGVTHPASVPPSATISAVPGTAAAIWWCTPAQPGPSPARERHAISASCGKTCSPGALVIPAPYTCRTAMSWWPSTLVTMPPSGSAGHASAAAPSSCAAVHGDIATMFDKVVEAHHV